MRVMIVNMSEAKHLSFHSIEHCRKFIMFARCCLGLKAWVMESTQNDPSRSTFQRRHQDLGGQLSSILVYHILVLSIKSPICPFFMNPSSNYFWGICTSGFSQGSCGTMISSCNWWFASNQSVIHWWIHSLGTGLRAHLQPRLGLEGTAPQMKSPFGVEHDGSGASALAVPGVFFSSHGTKKRQTQWMQSWWPWLLRPISALGNCKSRPQKTTCLKSEILDSSLVPPVNQLSEFAGGSSTARTTPYRSIDGCIQEKPSTKWLLTLDLGGCSWFQVRQGQVCLCIMCLPYQVPADHGGLRMNITKKMFDELRLLPAIWCCGTVGLINISFGALFVSRSPDWLLLSTGERHFPVETCMIQL